MPLITGTTPPLRMLSGTEPKGARPAAILFTEGALGNAAPLLRASRVLAVFPPGGCYRRREFSRDCREMAEAAKMAEAAEELLERAARRDAALEELRALRVALQAVPPAALRARLGEHHLGALFGLLAVNDR